MRCSPAQARQQAGSRHKQGEIDLGSGFIVFSATSPHQRIKGIELHERIARKFVDELLACEPGKVLLLHDAYAVFLKMAKRQALEPIKRSEFRDMMVPLIREQFDVGLRNDLVIDERQGVRGWKDLRVLNLTVPE